VGGDEGYHDIVLTTGFNNDMTFAGSPSPKQYNSTRANAANFEDTCDAKGLGKGVGLGVYLRTIWGRRIDSGQSIGASGPCCGRYSL
jgi:hypothetical protein